MAIPKITEQDIYRALQYIDANGVPLHNQSTTYDLIAKDGKKYPPKYVIAVADHLANGTDIVIDTFSALATKNFLLKMGFNVQAKQEEFILTITAESATSTDGRFTTNNLSLGDNYKPLDAYFKKATGEEIRRTYSKGERRNSNQTLPRIACQIFEKQLLALSVEEKENFPICRYETGGDLYRGIFSNIEEFKKHHNALEHLIYSYEGGGQFVIYCWNIFSTLLFVQECLKRFGNPGDKFFLTYREKSEKEKAKKRPVLEAAAQEELNNQFNNYRNPYSSMLIEAKNIIFHGAPGTGKSYLAKKIAADIISEGHTDEFGCLTDEQRKQIEFVQFHPSYDYTDFIEGLRPKISPDGTIGFELKDGVFKKFVSLARRNYEDSQKSREEIEKEISAQRMIDNYLAELDLDSSTASALETANGNKFTIIGFNETHIHVFIPGNETVKKLSVSRLNIQKMLESGRKFDRVKDVTEFFGKKFDTQEHSYELPICKAIRAKKSRRVTPRTDQVKLKKHVFIIDEINRGDISKIFGELFFAIDPNYRGKAGEVSTQYANLHDDPEEKFYIPDNVYIIGTMNDIDRSVDSFDFAMRRRFRFIELRADKCLGMLALLDDETLKNEAICRMGALNREIISVEELNENYQIGAAYFLKLKTLNFDQLWTDYLEPLLQDYVQGMYDEKGLMMRFARAYGYNNGDTDAAVQNQG